MLIYNAKNLREAIETAIGLKRTRQDSSDLWLVTRFAGTGVGPSVAKVIENVVELEGWQYYASPASHMPSERYPYHIEHQILPRSRPVSAGVMPLRPFSINQTVDDVQWPLKKLQDAESFNVIIIEDSARVELGPFMRFKEKWPHAYCVMYKHN